MRAPRASGARSAGRGSRRLEMRHGAGPRASRAPGARRAGGAQSSRVRRDPGRPGRARLPVGDGAKVRRARGGGGGSG